MESGWLAQDDEWNHLSFNPYFLPKFSCSSSFFWLHSLEPAVRLQTGSGVLDWRVLEFQYGGYMWPPNPNPNPAHLCYGLCLWGLYCIQGFLESDDHASPLAGHWECMRDPWVSVAASRVTFLKWNAVSLFTANRLPAFLVTIFGLVAQEDAPSPLWRCWWVMQSVLCRRGVFLGCADTCSFSAFGRCQCHCMHAGFWEAFLRVSYITFHNAGLIKVSRHSVGWALHLSLFPCTPPSHRVTTNWTAIVCQPLYIRYLVLPLHLPRGVFCSLWL